MTIVIIKPDVGTLHKQSRLKVDIEQPSKCQSNDGVCDTPVEQACLEVALCLCLQTECPETPEHCTAHLHPVQHRPIVSLSVWLSSVMAGSSRHTIMVTLGDKVALGTLQAGLISQSDCS